MPAAEGRNWFRIGLILWGTNICIPAFLLGGLIGGNARLATAMLAILAGSLFLTIISTATGVVGASTRMSTAMIARSAFGQNFGAVIAAIFAIVSFGWFGVQVELFGIGVIETLKILTHYSFNPPPWTVIAIGGILMSTTAVYGFKAIDWLSVLAVPLLVLVLAVTLAKAWGSSAVADVFAAVPKKTMPAGLLISTIIGGMAVGAVIMPDITRYAKSKGSAAGGMIFGMMAGFPLILMLSAILITVTGNADFTAVMLTFHHGAWDVFALLVVILATWTNNDNNLYSAALAFCSIFPRQKKWVLSAIGGALGTLMALAGIMQHFVQWLIVLGIAIPPIGTVIAINHFFAKAQHRHRAAWTAWILGAAAGYLSYFGALRITQAPAVDSIIVTAVFYAVPAVMHKRRHRAKA